MSPRRIASVLVAASAAAALFWAYGSHRGSARAAAAVIPIQDGKTIDFSNGSPVVGGSAADRAALEAGVREIDDATKNITFKAEPTPTK